ncbi:glycosyltransferase family 2 protein [Dysgonomonas sp. 520]|uniref:glycosyltransferase family 2 protein n=1 Tax=Dysgonomonas sp. 520 TaxID=2302931 RepID=UPI0013D0F013|nr:glycosyltransferase family 2 protein [Dysgonomonas sp. 520]NDW09012.1 glycosyltransferase family 2 protein [Dysgonomonas sp. 520]
MLDLSVIVLTYNEEIHIRRCIENVKSLAKDIFIVDSYSTDNTLHIAEELGAKIYQNKWVNNYAKQFNWGLENLPIRTKWVLRLDADEYLTEELINELKEKLSNLDESVTGIMIPLRRTFMGKFVKRGVGEVTQMRFFQYGKAQCEVRFMDEHIQLLEGEAVSFNGAWVDDNLNTIGWWTTKHNGYSIREAIDLLDLEFNLTNTMSDENEKMLTPESQAKRNKKLKYAKMPLFFRSFLYFIYRYIFKFGFTEGKEGFLWHFLQGWWYRTLVDAKVFEIKKACGNDRGKMIKYIKDRYGIDCLS